LILSVSFGFNSVGGRSIGEGEAKLSYSLMGADEVLCGLFVEFSQGFFEGDK
jgi:hypothetical protein